MRLFLFFAAAAPLLAQDCSTLTAFAQPTAITAAQSSGTVGVSAPAGCLWTYSTDVSWLSITIGQPKGVGSGNGTIGWTAAPNILGVVQVGTISIIGTAVTATVKITQEAAPTVTMSIQPTSAAYGVGGGSGSFQVQVNWYWSAVSTVPWITAPYPTGGTSSGSVTYSVAANPCASPRVGTISVKPAPLANPAQPFQITQDGSPDNLSLGTTSLSVAATASDGRVNVTTGAGCSWSAYSDSGNWLQITTGASGSGAGSFTYHAVENTAGTARTGHINVGPKTLTVTQQGAAGPPVTLSAVVNAASYASGVVSPGEIVALGGTNMGPSKGLGFQLSPDQASLRTEVGGTTVLFDGVPAALTYVSATQVNAVVPYGVAGKTTTQAQVQYQGVTSNTIALPVLGATPGIFTLDASGMGAGAILNQDYSINSAVNAAARGSVVMIYCTGGGVTNPASADASLTTTDPNKLPRLTQKVSVTIGGQPATLWYAGGSPTVVAGLTQINAQIPNGIAPGSSVPVVVQIGDWQSQAGVTIAVK